MAYCQGINLRLRKNLIFFSHLVSSPPIGLKADSTKPTSITISWQPPHDVNGIIRGYQVSYTPHGETECLLDVVGDTTSIELTSLKPHTKYTICVRAKTVGFGDYCTPITVNTHEDSKIFFSNSKCTLFQQHTCTYISVAMPDDSKGGRGGFLEEGPPCQ